MIVEKCNIEKLNFGKADAYIFEKGYNRKYFSGFSSSFGYLIVGRGFEIYVTDARYKKACSDHFEGGSVAVEINANLAEVLKKHADKFVGNIKKIGFEGDITVETFEGIKSAFLGVGEFDFANVSDEIKAIRAVKTEKEISKIAHAMDMSAKAYNAFLETVEVGQTERELCANLNHQLFLHGADTLAFETIIASGANGAKPHATPGDRKIQSGDFITCDFGSCIDGYNSDITRTFAVGEVSKKQLEVYNVVRDAQETSMSLVSAGKPAKEIHEKAMEIIAKSGYGEYFTHGLGHGVGVEIHESPTLNGRSKDILQSGNIVTIEPGVYIENEFGLRIEDTIVVKEGGFCNLNPLSKELIVINSKKHLKNL